MSPEENVAIVQRGYEAFNTADMDTLTELFHEDAAWHVAGRSPLANDYEGRDAAFGFFGQIGEQTDGTFRAEVQQLFAGEDGRVVGLQRSKGQRDGKSLDVGVCIVFELKDGKIVDGREHHEDLHAWDEFWS
jgi:ketosteroid isomerase-like protein